MGTAFFIVTEEEVDFETFVNGKSIARAGDDFEQLCGRLGMQTLMDFYSQDPGEFFDEAEVPAGEDVKWFDAEDGLNWAQTLKEHLEENPGELMEGDSVIEDLKEYIEVLSQLEAVGVRWHLELDF